jgi:hypothetical protein
VRLNALTPQFGEELRRQPGMKKLLDCDRVQQSSGVN